MTEKNISPFDYKSCQSVGEWKREVEKRGKHLSIAVCHHFQQFMKKNNLTFPEAYERAIGQEGLILVEDEIKRQSPESQPEKPRQVSVNPPDQPDDPDDYVLDTAIRTLDRCLEKKKRSGETG